MATFSIDPSRVAINISFGGQRTIPPQVANNAFIYVCASNIWVKSMLQCAFLGVTLVIFPTFFQDFIVKRNFLKNKLKKDSHL
jgi:hypothetical protein